MVGLPARGKTYIACKGIWRTRGWFLTAGLLLTNLLLYSVSRYLTWLGIKTQIFSVGNYRRKIAGLNLPHTFFDVHNEEAVKKRHEAAAMALNDMIQWFNKEDGTVGILDATNSTKKARAWINQELTSRNIQVLFIESICDDENVILHNIKDVKLSSPDYCNRDSEAATEDFMKRISHYEAYYETITEQDLTYIKLINVGSQYIINMIRGYLESRIVYYLMNLHTRPKRIWFSRVSGISWLKADLQTDLSCSMASRCSIWRTRLEVTQDYHLEANNMHWNCLSWSSRILETDLSLFGPHPWHVLFKPQDICHSLKSSGKHWMSLIQVSVMEWHMMKLLWV